MRNTIIDVIKIPMDEDGCMLYTWDEINRLVQEYATIFKGHEILVWPDNVHILEDLDIEALSYMAEQIKKVIEKKMQG